jgi:glycosyltransferase involved in cell wall biosynthesis
MSEFHRVLLGLHAQARRIDRDQALLGALGVGAFAYPHQIDSVHRMITGTECRWLLADEVGLGKTIQAIMVMRALAAQSPTRLRVALVVPDDLVAQWEEELLCRGHVLALEHGDDTPNAGNLIIKLARPSALARDIRIVGARTDLMLVDEFPRFTVQVRRDLVNAAREIPNVVLMTATPALHVASTRRELLAILEPEAERVAQAEQRDILEVLEERERSALDRYKEEFHERSRRRAVEESFGLYRRLINTKRSDYPDALPQRVYQPIRLMPTDGDVERGRTTREYLSAARAANVDIRSDLLLQVAGRSPRSLRDRLSTLRRTTAELATAWRNIDTCLREQPGDARLDALIDHIRSVHCKNPDARIIVVGEDNPTTDYLREALEKLADVQVANKRRSTGAADDLQVHVTVLKDALDDFIAGEAKLLVAADIAREGHNLQFAEEIIFYTLPWSPSAIQQWIGRIDRLGTKGLPSRRQITVTPLVVDGSIESRVFEVLDGAGVFQRSEIFDESEWAEISDGIDNAAYGSAGVAWDDVSRRARSLGSGYDEWLLATRIPPSPRTPLALDLHARLFSRAYAVPLGSAEGAAPNWFHSRERAAEILLRVAREDYLDIRRDQDDDQPFRTMWYRSRPGDGDLIFPELDPRSPWHRQTYITRRSDFCCPPRTHVEQKDGYKRRLHFFDHGNVLHDSIIGTLELHAPKPGIGFEYIVEFPDGHPILRWADQHLLLAVAEIDPITDVTFDADAVLGPSEARLSKPEQDRRDVAVRQALSEFQADRRWLLDLCPRELVFAALVEERGVPSVVDAASALFDPVHNGEIAQQRGKQRCTLSEPVLRAARDCIRAQLKKAGGERLGRAILAVKNAAKARLFAARANAENIAAAARAERDAAIRLDSRFEFNRAEQRAGQLAVDLAELVWSCRRKRLETAAQTVEAGRFDSVKMLWLLPRRRPDAGEIASR